MSFLMWSHLLGLSEKHKVRVIRAVSNCVTDADITVPASLHNLSILGVSLLPEPAPLLTKIVNNVISLVSALLK